MHSTFHLQFKIDDLIEELLDNWSHEKYRITTQIHYVLVQKEIIVIIYFFQQITNIYKYSLLVTAINHNRTVISSP